MCVKRRLKLLSRKKEEGRDGANCPKREKGLKNSRERVTDPKKKNEPGDREEASSLGYACLEKEKTRRRFRASKDFELSSH